ncbi:MAG: hypothetical protein REI12_13755 [Pedobacter sp.]|nr:hypothetical protein [Pedobacter sp.]
MKFSTLLPACLAACCMGNAFADDAYLRLRCEGEAAGAVVSINGVKKGECPIDLAIPEGEVKLSVRKSVNQYSYKLYEKDMLLSAGAMKRENVILGPLLFTPEGQRIENERLAREKADADAKAAAEQARQAQAKAEADAKAAALAEQQRREAEEAAKYGMTKESLDIISSHFKPGQDNISSWTLWVLYSPVFLPLSTLSDLSSGKKLFRTAADPAAFANPDSMVARAGRQQVEPAH